MDAAQNVAATMPASRAQSLLTSYKLHLHAEGKSAHTIRGYLAGIDSYRRYVVDELDHEPDFERASVTAWMAWLLDRGVEASSVVVWCRGPRLFSAWMLEEGERDTDPLVRLPQPRVHVKVPLALSPDDVKLMLSTCGSREMKDVRDAAAIRLLYDSGMRIGEMLRLELSDVDLRAGTVLIRKAKSGRGRVVPVGAQTTRALDRWLRFRSRSSAASRSPMFWLSARSQPWSYHAAYVSLKRRAGMVGLQFHPHCLRASFAIRWTESGGSAAGLLSIAGWADLSMAQRYMASATTRLAVDEHRRLAPGDL
jgi:site-specific recombinase XerD